MYSDIKVVLSNIKNHFEKTLGEKFEFFIDAKDRYAIFESPSYYIEITASFVQARVNDDFQVPIEQRITETQANQPILPAHKYVFASKIVKNDLMPIEYTFDEIS